MAYTFGGATGDDFNWTAGIGIGGDNGGYLACIWVYPTTLTATRVLWSWGASVNCLQIDTTTDEVRLVTDWSTTDAVHTSTGVDMVVDTWKFIAVLSCQENTGDTQGVRMWAGDLENPPVEVTVTTTTAGVGAPTASTTACVGNGAAAATVAFQGDIEEFGMLAITNVATLPNPLNLPTSGSISNDAANWVLENRVRPFWRGEAFGLDLARASLNAFQVEVTHLVLNNLPIVRRQRAAVGDMDVAPTINGATLSERRGPRANPLTPLTLIPNLSCFGTM